MAAPAHGGKVNPWRLYWKYVYMVIIYTFKSSIKIDALACRKYISINLLLKYEGSINCIPAVTEKEIDMVLFLITSLLFSSTGPGGFELGVILGEPTGISAKLWFDRNTALDGALSWSLRDNDKLHIHADFLWHDYTLIKNSSGLLPVYYGIGGRIILADDAHLGVRVPIGISWLLGGAPLDLFIELAGILDIVPDLDFDLNGGIGIRFIF